MVAVVALGLLSFAVFVKINGLGKSNQVGIFVCQLFLDRLFVLFILRILGTICYHFTFLGQPLT